MNLREEFERTTGMVAHSSASIVRNHVREGLHLADAERMPRSIRYPTPPMGVEAIPR